VKEEYGAKMVLDFIFEYRIADLLHNPNITPYNGKPKLSVVKGST
jgi:hypothetical protein